MCWHVIVVESREEKASWFPEEIHKYRSHLKKRKEKRKKKDGARERQRRINE